MVLQHNASVILSGLTCTFTEEINEWSPALAQKKDLLGRSTSWLDLSHDKEMEQVGLCISTAH